MVGYTLYQNRGRGGGNSGYRLYQNRGGGRDRVDGHRQYQNRGRGGGGQRNMVVGYRKYKIERGWARKQSGWVNIVPK